jgi:hypothetical protein
MEHYFTQYRHYEPIIIQNGSNNILWTVIAGVLVFIAGQLFLEFILKPLREYKNIKNEIFNKTKLYANIITNPISQDDLIIDDSLDLIFTPMSADKKEFIKNHNKIVFENYINISKEIRKLSCDLEVKYRDNYKLIRNILIKEKIKDIDNAVGCLIRISNCLFDKSRAVSNGEDIDNVKKYLNWDK